VCEPHKRIGRHVRSAEAEEVLLVLEGTAEVSLGDEQARLSAGAIALIPTEVPHEPLNVGSDTLRCVGYLSTAAALHTWEMPLMPMGSMTFVTPTGKVGQRSTLPPARSALPGCCGLQRFSVWLTSIA
jgi:hypothetical protein